jgi:hypothetical protein
MKFLRLFLTMFGGLLLTIGLTAFLSVFSTKLPGSATPALAGATTRYVATTGSDTGNDCSESNNPCATVQYSVDVANEGDEIRVAEGTYTGVSGRPAPSGYNGPSVITQVLYISKSLDINGGYDITNWITSTPNTNPSILDAQGNGRVIFIGTGATVNLNGLIVENGNAIGLKGSFVDVGGGMHILTSTVNIINSTISNNDAGNISNMPSMGGGIFSYDSSLTLIGNTIISNTTNLLAAGIRLEKSQAEIVNNIIQGNKTRFCCPFSSAGGGLSADLSDLSIEGNLFISNQAEEGSALIISSSQASLSSNIFANNLDGSIANDGKGVILDDGIYEFTNNVIQNSGQFGLYLHEFSGQVSHNTIINNHSQFGYGVGILLGSDTTMDVLTITNSIIVSQTVGIQVGEFNEIHIDSILWNAVTTTITGTGVISVENEYFGDPAFAPDGYHLTENSAALDNGIPTSVITDIDGEPRPYGAAPDLGADEYFIPTPPAAVNITGPTVGFVNNPYTFTATVTPISTTVPITYKWQATDQSAIVHSSENTDQAAFTWTIQGTKVLTVTASNITGTVNSTYTITINAVPPKTLEITGPLAGVPSTTYTFTAIVSPLTTTLPITYVWQAADQTPITHIAGISDTVTFIWATPGTKTITLTADNGFGIVTNTFTIALEVVPNESKIYLPIVTR